MVISTIITIFVSLNLKYIQMDNKIKASAGITRESENSYIVLKLFFVIVILIGLGMFGYSTITDSLRDSDEAIGIELDRNEVTITGSYSDGVIYEIVFHFTDNRYKSPTGEAILSVIKNPDTRIFVSIVDIVTKTSNSLSHAEYGNDFPMAAEAFITEALESENIQLTNIKYNLINLIN